MKLKVLAGFLILLILVGCNNQNMPTGAVIDFAQEVLPREVAQLPLMDLSSVENIERYQSFADTMNDLIEILNKENELFDIPHFEPTREGWKKASKFITEYGPLVNNYNEVVSSAQKFEQYQNEETLQSFYFASVKFAIETALIVGTVFYAPTYKIVGMGYRASGLNLLALKCGPCVSFTLKNAHWSLRGIFAEGSSYLLTQSIEKVTQVYQNGLELESVKNTVDPYFQRSKNKVQGINLTHSLNKLKLWE